MKCILTLTPTLTRVRYRLELAEARLLGLVACCRRRIHLRRQARLGLSCAVQCIKYSSAIFVPLRV